MDLSAKLEEVQGLQPSQKLNLRIEIDEIENGFLVSYWDKEGYHRIYREELHQIGEFIKTFNSK